MLICGQLWYTHSPGSSPRWGLEKNLARYWRVKYWLVLPSRESEEGACLLQALVHRPPTSRQASLVAALQPAVDQAESVYASDTLCVPSKSAKGEPPSPTQLEDTVWKACCGILGWPQLLGDKRPSQMPPAHPPWPLIFLPAPGPYKCWVFPPSPQLFTHHPSPGSLNQATRLCQLAPALPGNRPSVSLD